MDDPRLTAARSDLAASHLKGKVAAARYADGEALEIADAMMAVRRDPSHDAEQMTQGLKGERVMIYDRTSDGWAWGQLANDGYVGWMSARALRQPGPLPTHKVTALRTFAFPTASIKVSPLQGLSLGAELTVTQENGAFVVTPEGWHVPAMHVGKIDQFETDFVAVAEKFLGVPYLWGGKSSLGIDCSGLVQVSLQSAGIECLRDSDMQQHGLGRALNADESQNLQRGDLIFWKGHVAIVRDATTIVHANAFHMATEIENTEGAIARIAKAGSPVTAIKRLA